MLHEVHGRFEKQVLASATPLLIRCEVALPLIPTSTVSHIELKIRLLLDSRLLEHCVDGLEQRVFFFTLILLKHRETRSLLHVG